MVVIKVLLLVLSPVLVLVGAVWIISITLSVDDLKSCSAAPSPGDQQCQAADAVMAISGGDTSARTQEAIKLYQHGWAPRLILSGAALDKSGGSNAEAMRQQALHAGVPDAAIILDEQATDTAGNAVGLGAIANQYDIGRVILVTSPYHQHRAHLEFTRVLGDTIAISNHPTGQDRFWAPGSWWLNPYSWYLALGEISKVIYLSLTHG